LRLFSFGGYGLALAALALVVFSAYDSYPHIELNVNDRHARSRLLLGGSNCHGGVLIVIQLVASRAGRQQSQAKAQAGGALAWQSAEEWTIFRIIVYE